MAVAENGAFDGSVTAGCVEADVFEAAQEIMRSGRPELRHYGISDEQALSVGLSCGGEVDIWIEPDWLARAEEQAVAAELRRCLAQEEGVCLATSLDPGGGGPVRHMLVRADGTRVGTTGEAAVDARVAVDARPLLDRGCSETVVYQLPDGREAQVFIDAYPAPPTLLIFGGGHVAIPLVAFAKRTGFRTIVVDGRPPFATAERFPEADRVLVAWPEEAAGQLRIDRSTYVAVLNHDPKFDEPALKLALARGARYVGAIGSRRTRQQHLHRLRAQGVPGEDLARVHGPIGLDIGARTPEETAISILAEMIAERYGRPGGMLYRAGAAPAA